MIDKLLYIDIETNKEGKIDDVGAFFLGQELHEKQLQKLESWINQADYICGHNIIAHDIPLLESVLGTDIFRNKILIDTLLWSPILFGDNPYHKLVKRYKNYNKIESNNPLSDCKLTKELLMDEQNAFNDLAPNLQRIYASLLSHSKAYSGFLTICKFRPDNINLGSELSELFKNKICDSTNIHQIAENNPIELAYIVSLLNTREDKSVLAPWVNKTLPNTQKLINEIRFKFCGKPSCNYCNSNLNPKKALHTYFGYRDFRSFDENEEISLQEKTVSAGLSSKSFVAVFPTGGGKSLTFQLPALMKGSLARQLTVIISPLVSLMKDQVENLEKRFDITKAVAINGLLSPLEREQAIERLENGEVQLLYISPESLRSPTISNILRQRSIARFVIDEAHCFSSWGQDFRVDYLYIAEFIKNLESERIFNRIPVSCFTATAKPQVIEDIKVYFKTKLDIELDEYVTRASRTNLRYEVIEIEDPERKMAILIPLLERCEKPAIIYASRTKRVEAIHGSLEKAGFNSTYFHGKLDKDVKKDNMDAFMNDEYDIIVATSAFGMGVDKDDVKSVIHYNISDSLENYVQEAGRAGRDEKIQANCYILFNEQDLNRHFSLLQQTKINLKEIQQIWKSLKNLSRSKKSNKISHSALEIAQEAGWDTEIQELETRVKTSIAALEDQGFLKRKQNSPSIFANSLMVPNIDKALKIIISCEQITETQADQCARVLQRIVKDEECRIDYLADRTGLKLSQIRDVIDILRDLKILGDAKDLTAFINLTQSKNGSKRILDQYRKIEVAMQQLLTADVKISMRHLNQKINDGGVECEMYEVKNILNYWEIRGLIRKKRVDRENDLYKIKIKQHEELKNDIAWRHELTLDVYELLETFYREQQELQQPLDKKDLPVSFSMLELRNSNHLFGQIKEEDLKRYEKTLLFLNQIKSIKLEGGFMVSYNRLNIEDIADSHKTFNKDHFKKMEDHYYHKTEQIHIVGEYAKKRLQNYESALAYVNDYFSQPYEEFLAKYFPRRKKEIGIPLTSDRLKEITGGLDLDQLRIVNDGKSDNILVLAGPGSGKTKVLVHKIASLLLLEDIKPEQFLMLTFSKAASLEFRFRAKNLVPEYAGLIKITTFHGYCFQLLGQLGDLAKSENVIRDCINAINNEAIDISSIANKSVLLLDEFQDVNDDEWDLIQTIIKKAGNIRAIAVGDDDQNIYSFRGSSKSDNMQEFKSKFNATEYSLVKNYRSSARIVDFNNHLLLNIPNRLKRESLEPAQRQPSSKVKLIRYSSSYLEKSMVQAVISDAYAGTRAILVRTNKQALMLRTFLNHAGQKTKLITGLDGFSMDRLFELRTFTNSIKQKTNEVGLILNHEWEEAKTMFNQQFESNIHFEVCSNIISKFEMHYGNQKLLVDWYEYIREIKIEDAINPDNNSIIIATMHKAKGKEFDHVYLLLDTYDFNDAESKRLLYVACTRAISNLQIHCNSPYFDLFNAELLEAIKFEGMTEQPKNFEAILGHKDIYLKSQIDPRSIPRIHTLRTGDELKKDSIIFPDNIGYGLALPTGGNVSIFSQDFKTNKLATYEKDGYELTAGIVHYLVYWYDANTEKEYRVILPRLRFEKREK